MNTDGRNDLYTEMYRRMLLIRYFDEKVGAMHLKSEIPGSAHSTIGQEAEVVGACMAMHSDDYMVGNHRSHGHPIGKGADVKGLMAELMGRKTGVCAGKGGSMHLSDFKVGSLGETSIVGSGLPVAVGAALASKMMGLDRVTLCFFGDGASNQGTFHESLNLAAIWRLPVIFLCENNGYAVSMPASKSVPLEHIAQRAQSYAMPGVFVDGQDVLAVYALTEEAVARARTGGGPSLIEAKTYRYDDHAMNMGREITYRTKEELQQWMARDPLQLFRAKLSGQFGISADRLATLESQTKQVIEDAVKFASSSPFPDPSEAYTQVYSNPFALPAHHF